MPNEKPRDLKRLLKAGFAKALDVQQPMAQANVARLRRVHPEKSPADLIKLLNAYYLTAVTSTGAGAGAAAIVPNAVVQVPVAFADLLSFLEASVLYTLSVAEVHALDVEDIERRSLLVMAVLIGDSAASSALGPILGRTVPHWGRRITAAVPLPAIRAANKVLGPNFVTKYGTRQGILVLGKQIPLAIGVVVGAGGNHAFGWLTIKSARKILGPPPAEWPGSDTQRQPTL